MIRAILVLLLACLCQGCFVFEEIEKGQALMEAHSPKELEDLEPKPATRGPVKEEPSMLESVTESVQAWWQTESEADAPERDPADVPVACQIAGRTQYMRTSSCRVRGGKIL